MSSLSPAFQINNFYALPFSKQRKEVSIAMVLFGGKEFDYSAQKKYFSHPI
jgi:hypothetical protein